MDEAAARLAVEVEEDVSQDDLRAVKELAIARQQILKQIEKRLVGQHSVVEHLLVSLFSRGHCLFVGVPGLAKTLLISTLADVLNLTFNRVQFTPDLMPSDITGTEILEEDRTTGRREFRFLRGPLFANIVLADEVNRTPPKTQAALLQAMQEYRVTAGGQTFPLDLPFLVFATQNPIEQEGTYPLPEAQLDRFMFLVDVGYPTAKEEVQIVKSTTGASLPPLSKVLSPEKIISLQDLVRRVPVPEHVVEVARTGEEVEPGGLLVHAPGSLAGGAVALAAGPPTLARIAPITTASGNTETPIRKPTASRRSTRMAT